MNSMNLPPIPPLPPPGVVDPEVCEVVQRYLAVWDDLTPEQKEAASAHVAYCAHCSRMQHIMNQSTRLVAGLGTSTPSARVDQAVMAAIVTRRDGLRPPPTSFSRRKPGQSGTLLRTGGLIAAAVVIMLLTLTGVLVLRSNKGVSPSQQAFVLPATLTWAGYVLYHTETRLDEKGERYLVNTYYDLKTGDTRVETVQDGALNVIAISDSHDTLGLDTMHHIAQWGVEEWMDDESMFDLSRLHRDMQAKRAVYLDTDTFRGQKVYRIRCENGLVLLLDMHYMPVNVLRGAVGPGTGEPVYDTLQLLQHASVSNSMWDMRVPSGFQMGQLPKKP